MPSIPETGKIASDIIKSMIERKIAEKIEFPISGSGKSYFNLVTPDALDKDFVCLLSQGFPEKLGIWSNTLVKQNRISESSMEPYFRRFKGQNWGLVAIYPHCFGPDFTGRQYMHQLSKIMGLIKPGTKIGFIGFSAGGFYTAKFLNQDRDLADRAVGVVMLDPFLRKRKNGAFISCYSDKLALFAADSSGWSFGLRASKSFGIPAIRVKGIHGEIPNKSLDRIVSFFKQRME